MRTFLAIEIPGHLEQRLGREIVLMKDQLPDGSVRWLDPDSIHLTMKFLGDVSPAKLDAVRSTAHQLSAASETMRLELGDFGVFPNMDRPRVLWIGVREGTGRLQRLKTELERGMEELGFEPERRDFTPHLTVGRVQRDIDRGLQKELGGALHRVQVDDLGQTNVEELTLFKSDLQPAGAVYTVLDRFRLGGE